MMLLPGDVVAAPQVLAWFTAVSIQPCVRCTDHARGCTAVGQDVVGAALAAFFDGAFAAADCTVTALAASTETRIVAMTLNGRPQRPFWGLPASDRAISLPMVLVGQGVAGLHTIDWYYDAGTLLRQMGLALPLSLAA